MMKKLVRSCIALLLLVMCMPIEDLSAQQTTDLTVTEISLPPELVPQIQPILVAFRIENIGDANAANFFCTVTIFSRQQPSVPIFQNQIPVPQLPAGQSQPLQSQQTWLPPEEGEYIVQVAVLYEFDNTPSNNVLGKDFRVGQETELLSLQEAVAILNADVLENHPRADELVALHLSPPANPSDSLIPPGLQIESADGSVSLQYEYPVYFFFVDLHPDELFAHPVEYVAISAVDGSIDRQTDVELWPEIDGVTPDFGPYCFGNDNPRRVRGNPVQCVAKGSPYQPVATPNTGAWALVVVGKLNLDVEKTTAQHDICRWKERINGNTLGPGVTGPNISAHTGKDNCGLTEDELCKAIEGLKGKECDKVHFKYIGHGTTSGVIVWDNEHKRAKTLSWDDLAAKLKEAGVSEVCIEITSCHSGAAINALKKKGIKGTVITSSSSGNTTPVGDGSGTHWEKSLEACSKDPMADLNRNGKIDPCELFAWVKVRGGTPPNGPNPQIEKLNDSIGLRSVRLERVGGEGSISTNGGPIKVYAERICMKLSVKQGNRRRDSTVYRGAVYIENTGNTRRNANRDYSISARCGKETVVLVPRIRPSLGPGEKQCIADLPENCTGITVERLRNGTVRKDDPDHIVLSAAPDESLSSLNEFVPHSPGDFAYYRYILEDQENDQHYTASVAGPQDWFVRVEPGSFNIPETDSQDVFTGVVIPDTATAGGEVVSTVVNTATNDTLLLRYNIFLVDTLAPVTPADRLDGRWKWYEAVGDIPLAGFNVSLSDVQISVRDSHALRMEGVGTWRWNNVVADADSGGTLTADIGLGAGSTIWEDVAIRGTGTGLFAEAGSVVMRNVTIGASGGDGVHFRGNRSPIDTVAGLRIETLDFLNVMGSLGHGLVLDDLNTDGGTTDTVRAHGLRISFVDSSDIVLRRNSHLWCYDCEYDEMNVAVDATSTLIRLGTVNIAATDTAGNGLADVNVTIRSLPTGQTIVSLATDAQGLLPGIALPFSLNIGGNRQKSGPYEIIADNGITQMRDTVDPIVWTRIFFDFTEGPASIPVAGEKRDAGVIIRVIPQPVSADGTLLIETEGIENGEIMISLHNTRGEELWRRKGLRLKENGVRIPAFGSGLASGVYILRLHQDNGKFVSAKLVVH